jgi:hypothetical protein
MRARLPTTLALLAALAGPAAAGADDDAAPPAAPGIEEMYRQALVSIIEGRKNDASVTLRRLIELEPLHAGAWLDLALIQCGLGHAAEAEDMFAIIERRFAPPPAIARLIAEARAGGCDHWQGRGTFGLSAGRGYDQNVNQGSSTLNHVIGPPGAGVELPLLPEFLRRADHYSLLAADYTRDLSANGTMGYAQLQWHRNDRLHEYDSGTLFVGFDTPWRWRAWTMRAGASVGLITLGGRLYQRQAQVQGQFGPPLPLPAGMRADVIGAVSRAEYLTLTNFNSTTADLRLRLSHQNGGHNASVSVGVQTDRAGAERPGGDRRGASVQLQWRQRLGAATAELAYSAQDWRSARAYSDLIEQVRDQRTRIARGTLTYPLGGGHSVLLELRDVRNRENISLFQYASRQVQLSWQWQGP